MKISAAECLGYHKISWNNPRLDKKCSRLVEQRKTAKMQWLQVCNQRNGERYYPSEMVNQLTYERISKKQSEMEINSKNKNISNLQIDINELKVENGDLFADFYSTLRKAEKLLLISY